MLQEFIARNDADFKEKGAAILEHIICEAAKERGYSVIGLSGGSTPREIYEALGRSKNIDWTRVWIFLVDDRYVPADSTDSNQFLLRSTLLKNAPIPESQIIFPDTTLPISACVDLYDKHLKSLLRKGSPDIVSLGMGDDGHIASLFPPLEDSAFGPAGGAIHTTTDKFAVKDRISVTMPVLERARRAVFFLRGAKKRRLWEEMIGSDEDKRRWPAKAILKSCVSTLIFL